MIPGILFTKTMCIALAYSEELHMVQIHNLHIFVHIVSESVAQRNSIKKVFLFTSLHTVHRNVWGNVIFSPNKN